MHHYFPCKCWHGESLGKWTSWYTCGLIVNNVISITYFHTSPPITTMCVGYCWVSLSLWMLSTYVPQPRQARSCILSPYCLYMGRHYIVCYSHSHGMFPLDIISLKLLLFSDTHTVPRHTKPSTLDTVYVFVCFFQDNWSIHLSACHPIKAFWQLSSSLLLWQRCIS